MNKDFEEMFGHLFTVLPAPWQQEPLWSLEHRAYPPADFFLKGQMVNILGFAGQSLSQLLSVTVIMQKQP